MDYLTFIGRGRTMSLYRGIGAEGDPLAEREAAAPVQAMSGAREPVLWVSGRGADGDRTSIERVAVPALTGERIEWQGGRVGSLACSPDGSQVVVLELPDDVGDCPRLWRWDGSAWQEVETDPVPDISSKLAWLDGGRLAYESAARRLTVVDLESGRTEEGPPGCCPAAATLAAEWYAVSDGRVVRFAVDGPPRAPAPLEGVDFADVATLAVTHDGQVFTWIEPGMLHRLKGYVQQRGNRRNRFRAIDDAIGAVVGPFALT
jgi:hypothetical protein